MRRASLTSVDRAGTALVLAALATATACSGGGSTPAPSPRPLPAQFADCPSLRPSDPGQGAAVDYVDFVQAFHEQYVAGLASRPIPVARGDLGRVVLRSRCSLAALNDRTHQDPGSARDGDTAFLAPGTPIYAVTGWPVRCRLAARSTAVEGFVAYLALQPNAETATPRPCALHR